MSEFAPRKPHGLGPLGEFANTWEQLASLPEEHPARARQLLQRCLEDACRATTAATINLGRWGLCTLPRGWLLDNVRTPLFALLRQGDGWEYRRALELASLLDSRELVTALIAHGTNSDDGEIRAMAVEWEERDRGSAGSSERTTGSRSGRT
ncbi:MAG: hypothetical protein AB7O24_25145 [Kofleriaceae bacterium]